MKAIFKLNKYLYKFTAISVKHKLELFDKLVVPILNYGSEVWGFHNGNAIERIHMQFCKRLLGNFKLMKGKALRKQSLHKKTAASVLLKPFISSNE